MSSGHFSHSGVLFSRSVKRKVRGLRAMAFFLKQMLRLFHLGNSMDASCPAKTQSVQNPH
jgi:hypothetical protein